MRSVAPLLALAFVVAVPTAAARAQDGCPMSGITTSNYGLGVGAIGNPTLKMSWGGPCAIDVEVQAVTCCNTFLARHYLAYLPTPVFIVEPQPILLPPPFFPGCELYYFPEGVLGPFEGKTTTLAIPPLPFLVGVSLEFQAVLEYLTFGQFDGLGTTDGVSVTFH